MTLTTRIVQSTDSTNAASIQQRKNGRSTTWLVRRGFMDDGYFRSDERGHVYNSLVGAEDAASAWNNI